MATSTPTYSVGIDLGTTNSVIAYARLGDERPTVELLPVPQLVAAATVEPRDLLPSFLYVGTDADRDAKALDVPWAKKRDFAVGELARKQSADVPTRTVVGAKSWLAHSRVDRRQPILPWNAPDDVPKVSPVEASRRYLEHAAAAWAAAHPDAPLAEQQVVLTVPASFDAAARDLTREAAVAAGLPDDTILLEEPQAALYAWLADRGDRWRRLLKVGDTLLVADVGGGTTDFTLVGVTEERGDLNLTRIAVGRHTLVGGDNMDLALAHHAAAAFAAKNVPLDPWQSVALWHSCRAAKEALLAEQGPAKQAVSVLGRGRKVIGGTVSVDLERDAVRQLLVDGFFPTVALTDKPQRQRVSGFQQIGLPFETDTAVTRHLAAFLSQQGENGQAVRPTHLLFNGGVFKAASFRQRLSETIGSWFGGTGPQVLEGNDDLDFAVARGAAYYGFTSTARASASAAGRPAATTSASRRRACHPRRPAAAAGAVRRPVRDGGGDAGRRPERRDRPGRRRAGHVPVLLGRRPQAGQAGRPGRPLGRGRVGGDRQPRGEPAQAGGRGRGLRAGPVPEPDQRAGRVRAVVREHGRGGGRQHRIGGRPAVEAGVQRAAGRRLNHRPPRTDRNAPAQSHTPGRRSAAFAYVRRPAGRV
jgi:molecular chaperone DnaK (HSP70)